MFFLHDLDHMFFFKDSAMDFFKDYFFQHRQMSKATDVHINNRAQHSVCFPVTRTSNFANVLIPPLFMVMIAHSDIKG